MRRTLATIRICLLLGILLAACSPPTMPTEASTEAVIATAQISTEMPITLMNTHPPPTDTPIPPTSTPTPPSSESVITPVVIDGQPDDWADYPVLLTDREGDTFKGGFDLKSVRTFTNDQYFYLLLDAYGDIGEYVQVDLDIDVDGDGNQDYMATFRPRTGRRDFGDFTSGKDVWGPMRGGSAAEDNIVEFKMPLTLIAGRKSFTLMRIRVMNGICCAPGQWYVVDDMGPVSISRSNEREPTQAEKFERWLSLPFTVVASEPFAINDTDPAINGARGLFVNEDGTKAYIVGEFSGKLSWVNIDLTSSAFGKVTTIADDLFVPTDVAVNRAETVAYVTREIQNVVTRVDLMTGEVATVTTQLGQPTNIALSQDENEGYVVDMQRGRLNRVNLTTGAIITTTTKLGKPFAVAVNRVETLAYITTTPARPGDYPAGDLLRVNLKTGRVFTVAAGIVKGASGITLSADERLIVVTEFGNEGDCDGRLSVINVDPTSANFGKKTVLVTGLCGAHDVRLNRAETILYFVEVDSSRFSAIQVNLSAISSPIPPTLDQADEPSGVAVTPDGNTLYVTAHKSHNVFVIDVASKQVLDVIDPTDGGTVDIVVDEIVITHDGRWAVITNPFTHPGFSGSVTILNLSDNSVVDTVYLPNNNVARTQVSSDSNTAYVAGPGSVFVVDILGPALVATIDLSPYDLMNVEGIALSLDGSTLYVIAPIESESSRLALIDTATRTVSEVINIPIADVICFCDAAISPDGNELYAVDRDNHRLFVLDLLNNAALLAEIEFPQEVLTIEFDLDGTHAYVGGFTPGGIYVIDTTTYTVIEHINPLEVQTSDMHALDMAPDGSLLFVAAADADGVFFIDTATNELDTYLNLNPILVWPMQLALSNDGRWLYTGGIEYSLNGKGRVYVIDTQMRSVVEHIPLESSLVAEGSSTDFQGFALSPDETRIYTGGCARSRSNPDRMLSLVVDLHAKEVVSAIDLGSIQTDVGDKVAVSIDGSHVYYTLTAEQHMLVASTQTLQVVDEISLGFEPISIELSHDGTRAFVAGGAEEPVSHSVSCMAIVDLTTNTVVNTIIGTTEYPPPCPGLAVAPDSSEAWLGSNNRVEIINIDTASIVQDINLLDLFTAGDRGAACPYGITYSPDGLTVHVANFDANNYMIFDAATRELLHKVNVGFSPTDIVISSDGNEAYVLNSQSESISVIDTNAGRAVDTISLLNPRADISAGGA